MRLDPGRKNGDEPSPPRAFGPRYLFQRARLGPGFAGSAAATFKHSGVLIYSSAFWLATLLRLCPALRDTPALRKKFKMATNLFS